MRQMTLLQRAPRPEAAGFFPRIIREFDDADEPMYYAGSRGA